MGVFQLASAADSDDILQLFRSTPQHGRVLLNFEREPDYFFGSQVTCETPEVHIARNDKDELLMLYAIGQRTSYINGEQKPMRYAHDLRIAEHARGGRLILRLSRHVGSIVKEGEIIQTVILNENKASMNSVASGRAGLPTYYPYGDIETSLIFRMPKLKKSQFLVRQAGADDIAIMQQFHDQYAPQRQLYPRYKFAGIEEGHPYFNGLKLSDYWLAFRADELVGMAALWDQKHFKQTRVLAYPRGLSWLRYLWNFWARLVGGLYLPPAGGSLHYLMLHSVLVQSEQPQVLRELLVHMSAYASEQGAAISAGFFHDDPLRSALQGCRRQTMQSQQFLIGYYGDPRVALDDRPGSIELARL
jgi:hypothetical protein